MRNCHSTHSRLRRQSNELLLMQINCRRQWRRKNSACKGDSNNETALELTDVELNTQRPRVPLAAERHWSHPPECCFACQQHDGSQLPPRAFARPIERANGQTNKYASRTIRGAVAQLGATTLHYHAHEHFHRLSYLFAVEATIKS